MGVNMVMETTQEELKYRIALTLLPQVGLKRAKDLMCYFGNATAFFAATEAELLAIPNIGRNMVQALLSGKTSALQRAERELLFMAKHNIRTYCFTDDDYPYRLQNCADAPFLLFGKGNIEVNGKHMLSVVGTRQPTDRGREICHRLILDLAERVPDLTIVSGLAYGIDVCAHRAALEAGIPTIIIPGHGLDRIYPAMHRQTAIQALEKGGILTEFLSETTPDRQNFVARNRIVAGMSDATLVIESKAKGGSLITADMAFGYARDVFAVPGRVNDEQSAGCNGLIKQQKAAMIECADDIIQAMQWETKDEAGKAKVVQTVIFDNLSPVEERLLGLLRQEPDGLHVNLLVMETGLPYAEVTTTLLTMEMAGMVRSLPGSIYRCSM